jgi:hypothetical protein
MFNMVANDICSEQHDNLHLLYSCFDLSFNFIRDFNSNSIFSCSKLKYEKACLQFKVTAGTIKVFYITHCPNFCLERCFGDWILSPSLGKQATD